MRLVQTFLINTGPPLLTPTVLTGGYDVCAGEEYANKRVISCSVADNFTCLVTGMVDWVGKEGLLLMMMG